MKFTIDKNSSTPLYRQVIDNIRRAAKDGTLADGEPLPSLNQLAEEYGISMETAKKAYTLLKKEGLLAGRQGKGYFADIRKEGTPKRILMMLDKLSAYKLAIHKGLSGSLAFPADIVISIHNQDIDLFEKIVYDSVGAFDYYIVAAHFPREVDGIRIAKSLSHIPNDRLILIDRDIPQFKGNIGRIYQDFYSDASEALGMERDRLSTYSRVILVASSVSRYSSEITPPVQKTLRSMGMKCTTVTNFSPASMQPGTLFIVIGGQLDTDHFAILREAIAKGYTLGKAVGLISYNDEPVNEFICGGLTCLSTDFEQMGRSAAWMINTATMAEKHNPFSLVRRNTF